MITRILYTEEKRQYNSLITHPLQTWEWGDFLAAQGHKVYRLGVFDNNKLVSAYSVNFHSIPKTSRSVGVLQRGPAINQEMITNVAKIARDERALFVKFEPNSYHKTIDDLGNPTIITPLPQFQNLVISPKVAFFPYSYIVDLTQSEDRLLERMHSKTRYNIKVANRHGVVIEEDNSELGFEIYLKLLFDTAKRQAFYMHTPQYHRNLYKILKPLGMIHIMLAKYQGKCLSAFMLFQQKDHLFYPYGASVDENREVMASTLLMWESIRLGKKLGCTSFDMWGSLGPDAKSTEQGYGFHRFKEGFGGQLTQFVGTYDLVVDQPLYQIYNFVDKYRWKLLRFKAKFLR